MVKCLATLPHDPLGITDSACKNLSVMVSVQCSPFNTNISIRSTTIGKSRVARDPITLHTSSRSNSDIACVTSVYFDNVRFQNAVVWRDLVALEIPVAGLAYLQEPVGHG
ncbi:hypothetical protein F511_28887 [Dorcoceras hygrometricum]|uniref:Uncharacterized protein n=1 Tax=Dorcoceras hygrometricum TaxID=472368 RepID=A0A2Z7CX20_9LAMI|nr:hypothetical protein F511_28887 [Dorcoceras hygrometricum]